jgi:hypothetical protein
MFEYTKNLVKDILKNPHNREWTLQGFGMLRTYIHDKNYRLHIWNKKFAKENVTLLHNHPWDFDSLVISGRLYNYKYVNDPRGNEFYCSEVFCGAGGGLTGEIKTVKLLPLSPEQYLPKDTYYMKAEELHISGYDDHTISIIKRVQRPNPDCAMVFWPKGTTWQTAEPFAPSKEIIEEITSEAYKNILEKK